MPKFDVTGPDGQTYTVNAPEGASEADAISFVKTQYYSTPSAPKKPAAPSYAKMDLAGIQAEYQRARKAGADDKTLASIADAYVQKEQAERSTGLTGVVNAADNFVRDFARGVPIVGGALDEVNAGVSALTGGDYNETLDYQRARDRYNDKTFGALSTGTQIAGGVASGIGAARMLGLGGAATSAPGAAAQYMPTVGGALRGAAAAAPVGAADMFTRAEGDGRLGSAAVGAVLGGGLGFAAPYIAGGVASGTQRFMDFLKQDANLQKLGISRDAANQLLRQLQIDDTLTTRGAARIRAAGPDAMLADAGDASANLLDTALQKSGQGSTAAREAIEQRATAANRGLQGQLDNTFGAPVGVETRQAGIRQSTAAARNATYKSAYATPIDYSTPEGQQVAALWQRVRAPIKARANALLEEAGEPIIEDGALPNVQQIDFVKRALDAVAESGEGQGAMGGVNAIGRSAQNLARELRQATRDAVPEYGIALDTAADPIERIKAIEFGATLLNKQVTRESVREALRGSTGAERQAMMQGVRDQLDEIVANVKSVASDPNVDARQLRELVQNLSSKAAREKVAALVGPEKARAFFGQVGRFGRASELRASVARNSATFQRTAIDAQVKAQINNSVIKLAQAGQPMKALQLAIQKMNRMDPVSRLEAEDALYSEISKLLTTTRGKNAEKMLRRLQLALRARSQNSAVAQRRGADTIGTITGLATTGSEGLSNLD
jgi:hypothetical protein